MLRRLFALVILAGFAAGGLYYWKSRPESPRELQRLPDFAEMRDKVRDAAVTTGVRTAFALNRTLQPLSIEVSTEDAVVTLRGDVPTAEARSTAERVARDVPEVRKILNQLKIRPGSGPAPGPDRSVAEAFDDEKLAVQVRLALSLNRRLEGLSLEVACFKKIVKLSGEVDTPAQKAVATAVAKETAGVAGVTDALRVRGKS